MVYFKGLFCRRDLSLVVLLRKVIREIRSFAEETYNLIDPSNRSHHIPLCPMGHPIPLDLSYTAQYVTGLPLTHSLLVSHTHSRVLMIAMCVCVCVS